MTFKPQILKKATPNRIPITERMNLGNQVKENLLKHAAISQALLLPNRCSEAQSVVSISNRSPDRSSAHKKLDLLGSYSMREDESDLVVMNSDVGFSPAPKQREA